jgi:multidrug efflux pump subunit AcrB
VLWLWLWLWLWLGVGGSACRGRERPPDTSVVDPPTRVELRVDAPGMSAFEVESLIVIPLEESLHGLPSLSHMTAEAGEGRARVLLEIERSSRDPLAVVEAHLDDFAGRLPMAAGSPELRRVTEVPPVHFGVLGDVDPAALRAVHAQLVAELQRIRGVVEVRGCAPREVVIIELDPERLARFGVDLRAVERALQSALIDLPSGAVGSLASMVISAAAGPLELSALATIRIDRELGGCTAVGTRGPALTGSVWLADERARPSVLATLDAMAERAAGQVEIRRLGPGLRLQLDRSLPPEAAVELIRSLVRTGVDWWLEFGLEHEPCASVGSLARVYAPLDELPLDALQAASGVDWVEHPGDPAERRVWIVGPDLDVLRELARQQAVSLALRGDLLSVTALIDQPWPIVRFKLDDLELAALGLDSSDVRTAIDVASGGHELGRIAGRDGASLPVVLRTGSDNLDALSLTTADGRAVRLTSVVEQYWELEPRAICRRDRERGVALVVRARELGPSTPIERAELSPGYRWIVER